MLLPTSSCHYYPILSTLAKTILFKGDIKRPFHKLEIVFIKSLRMVEDILECKESCIALPPSTINHLLGGQPCSRSATGGILIEKVLSHFHSKHLQHKTELTDFGLAVEYGI